MLASELRVARGVELCLDVILTFLEIGQLLAVEKQERGIGTCSDVRQLLWFAKETT